MTAPTLESWAATLGFLNAEIAAGIEPMARRLDLVIDGVAPASPGSLEPNGYAGLSRHGSLDRLMLSEWMLAGAEPDEFLRRLVSAELGYLEVERTEPKPPAHLAVLIDTGPSQIGAPRLAQLAVLLVLSRRAKAYQAPLVIGILGDTPGEWITGELEQALPKWLRARSAHSPSGDDVGAWLDIVETDTPVWLLTGGCLAHPEPDRIQVVRTTESGWGPAGVSKLAVSVAGKHDLELDMPSPDLGVQILRGEGLFRHTKKRSTVTTSDHPLRFPRFNSAARRLLMRGEGPDQVTSINVAPGGRSALGKLKERTYSGPVLAAAALGQRIVVLVAVGDSLRVEVVGKRIGNLAQLNVPMQQVGLDEDEVTLIASADLEPLYFTSGSLVVRLSGKWWRFHPSDEPRQPHSYLTLAASEAQLDQPRIVHAADAARAFVRIATDRFEGIAEPYTAHLGAAGAWAYQKDGGVWTVRNGATSRTDVAIADGATVLGVTTIGSEPVLVVRSPAGQLLRLQGPSMDRTLTKSSRDGIADSSVHPTLPLLALQRDNGRIDVLDLETSHRVLHVQPGSS